jgi:hypothetical protein
MLAVELASLYTGTNSVIGHCDGKRCEVSMTHAADEDVSAAVIRFQLKGDRAMVSTLECVSTP